MTTTSRLRLRTLFLSLFAAATLLLAGCATNNPRDPLEPFNRSMFRFNEALDQHVGQPVAKTYNAVVPALVRKGVSNFFNNTYDFVSSFNCLLQLRIQCGAENLMRFSVNTFFGLGGLLDIATEAGIPRTNSDFGITLGRYGIGSGPYLVLPFVGPSSFRDVTATAYGIDGRINPVRTIDSPTQANSVTVLGFIDTRARLLRASELFDDVAIDKYTFAREAFIQRRRNQVYNGNPPEEDDADSMGKDESGYSDKPEKSDKVDKVDKPEAPASAPK
jgi:phospholipid-binding lipoprotein MlaA